MLDSASAFGKTRNKKDRSQCLVQVLALRYAQLCPVQSLQMYLNNLHQLLGLLKGLADTTNHVEGIFWEVVALASDHLLE